MFHKIMGANIDTVINAINNHIDSKTKDQEMLNSIIHEITTKEVIENKFIDFAINELSALEDEIVKMNETNFKVLSSYLASNDIATGEKMFKYEFSVNKNEKGITDVVLTYSKNDLSKDPFEFVVKDVAEKIYAFFTMDEHVKKTEEVISTLVKAQIDDTIEYATQLIDVLVNGEITVEDYKKRLFLRLVGVKSCLIWKERKSEDTKK